TVIGPDRLPMPIVHAGESIDIVYEGGQFSPPRVELELGAEIYFSNSSDEPVWPASNIHPTHEIYPEFDPLKPLMPGESWAFKPNNVGAWRFHNHLKSDEGGMIVVLGDSTRTVWTEDVDPATVRFEPTPALTPAEGKALFDDDGLLTEWVQKYGPAAIVHTLSSVGQSLNRGCHERAHELGRIAYGLFGAGAFSLSGHECQSGSFHGATEALFRERGTSNLIEDVAKICSSTRNPFFRHNCVHGVGHGLMAWTNYALPEALELCDQLRGGNKNDAPSCYSGIFMENVVGGLSGQMGHFTKYLSDDPHYPCNAIAERHRRACYGYQTTRMVALFKADYEKLSNACEEAPDNARSLCFYSMGRDVGTTNGSAHFDSIQDCSYTKVRPYQMQCLLGVAQNAFWDASGADDAAQFCKTVLDPEFKTQCWILVMRRGRAVLSEPAQIDALCDAVEPGYHYRRPLKKLFGDWAHAINPFAQERVRDASEELCYRALPQLDRLVHRVRSRF
ncbi:MAG: hypothetical protein K0U93_31385, partial [Gammaproteobacteria bacterium]|nr:hypothetical protein [Gammaproteobacteria bacterium]